MASEPVSCSHCHGHDGVKHSRTVEGKQRYKCRHPDCPCTTFIRSYSSRGYFSGSQTADCRQGRQWQGDPRYCTGPIDQSDDGD